MLEVNIDLNPFGNNDHIKPIAKLFIANSGKTSSDGWDYTYVYHEPSPIDGQGEILFGGIVVGYDRNQSVQYLVSACLRQEQAQRWNLSAIRDNTDSLLNGPQSIYRLASHLLFEEKI